jgi:hypothetical protein
VAVAVSVGVGVAVSVGVAVAVSVGVAVAPSAAPPAATSQYGDCARWPPHANSAAEPVVVKVTTKSPALLPPVEPLCVGPVIESIVPPNIVRLRLTPANASAPATVRPSVENASEGNADTLGAGRDGHIDETPPPPVAQSPGLSLTSYVARKS